MRDPDSCEKSEKRKTKINMKVLISTIALGFSLYASPALPSTSSEEATIEYKQTIFGPRCEIRDPKIGFYGKGNCEKVIAAYERYKAAYKM
jgi:hypothetical protein